MDSSSNVHYSNSPHLQVECPFVCLTPTIPCNFINWSRCSPLVNMSAIISSVHQYFNSTVSLLTCSHEVVLYSDVFCSAGSWPCGLQTGCLQRSLSLQWGPFLKSVVSCHASCAAPANDMYSASAVDNATHVCMLVTSPADCHATNLKPVSWCWLAVANVTSPIGIWIANTALAAAALHHITHCILMQNVWSHPGGQVEQIADSWLCTFLDSHITVFGFQYSLVLGSTGVLLLLHFPFRLLQDTLSISCLVSPNFHSQKVV